ncbi:hypothetical protein LSH36_1331g00031, partial [Paralvinella palmiformis]
MNFNQQMELADIHTNIPLSCKVPHCQVKPAQTSKLRQTPPSTEPTRPSTDLGMSSTGIMPSQLSEFHVPADGAQKNPLKAPPVQIYCSCHHPHRQQMEKMIQCQACTDWYHEDCEGVV